MKTADWYRMIIESKAKKMAWDELDEADRRVYLAEAEKEFHREQSHFAKELVDGIKKTMSDPNYVSRADSLVYLKKQPKAPKKKSKSKKK